MRLFAVAIIIGAVLAAQTRPVQDHSSTNGAPNTADAPLPTVNPEDQCTIEGTVISATTGEPVKRAHLTLRPIGGQGRQMQSPYATMSDGSGRFLLNRIDPGRYVLSGSRDGFVMQAYSPDGRVGKNAFVTLEKGQKMTDLVFKLTPQGVITGKVIDQEGEPLSRVQIQLMKYTYQRGRKQLTMAGSGSTNDLGEYRMFGIPPGRYVLSAQYMTMYRRFETERPVGTTQAIQSFEEGYPMVFYPNAAHADSAATISVPPGGLLRGVDMTLVRVRTFHVRGRVNASANALRRRTVTVMLMSHESVPSMPNGVSGITDAKGSFDVGNVTPGSYLLFSDYGEDNQHFVARVNVDVGNANVDGIDVNFMAPSEIKGHVIVEDNGDLKGASLSINVTPKVIQPRGGGNGAQVKDDLTFVLQNLAPDAYDVTLYGFRDGFYVKSIRWGDQDITDTGLDTSSGGAAAEMIVVVNPNGGKVEGTVENDKGEKAVAATVTLIPDAQHRGVESMYKTFNTDQKGHFTISGIRPGDYKIYAWSDIEYGAYQDPEFLKPYESLGTAISIKEGGKETVQLKLISRTD